MKSIIWIIVIAVIATLMFIVCHGRNADIWEGRLHDNCDMCDIYRMLMADDTAFQLREMNRK